MNDKTLLNKSKINFLLKMLDLTKDLEGDIIECGVYKGGSLKIILDHILNWSIYKQVCGYDTFEGLPHSEGDQLTKGMFTCSYSEVLDYLIENTCRGFSLYKGIYPSTCVNSQVSFAHLDMDLGSATYISLKNLSLKMCLNGVIVLDDYEFPQTPGVKKAVELFLVSDNGFKIIDVNQYQVALKKVL